MRRQIRLNGNDIIIADLFDARLRNGWAVSNYGFYGCEVGLFGLARSDLCGLWIELRCGEDREDDYMKCDRSGRRPQSVSSVTQGSKPSDGFEK